MGVSKNKLLFIFCLFPFLELSIRHMSFSMELGWKAIPGCLGVVIFLLQIKADLITKERSIPPVKRNFMLLIVCYSLSMLFSGYYNDNLSIGILYTYTFYLGVFLYIDSWMTQFDDFIKVMNGMFIALIILSFVLMVVYPGKAWVYIGQEKCFVGALGDKNAVQMTIMPAIAMLLVQYYYGNVKNKRLLLFFVGLAILFLFLSKSGTAVIAATLLVAYLLLGRKFKISFKGLALIYVVIYFSIVIFRIQERLFYDLIVNVMDKDITLSDRTIIWDIILAKMKYAPLIGYGPKNTVVLEGYLYAGEAHNGFLEIFLAGGMLSLGLLISIICTVGKELDRYRNHPVAVILIFFLFLYSFMSLTENGFGYAKMLFWMMLIVSINIKSIIEQGEKERRGAEHDYSFYT